MEAGMDDVAAAEFRFLLSYINPEWTIPELQFGMLTTTRAIYEHFHQLALRRRRPRLQEEDWGWV